MPTVWEDTVGAEDRAPLESGTARELDPAPDVLVVGGGIVGLAAAVACRRAGLGRVSVVEAQTLACGPSGRAAGLLAPELHALVDAAPFVELARAGLALHRELDDEWNGAIGLRDVDMDVMGIALPGQAEAHPLRLAAAYARRAGDVVTGVAVTAIDTAGGRVVRVHTGAGDVSPGAVVLATGDPPRFVLDVSWPSVKGHLLTTEPAPFRLDVSPGGPHIAVRQLPDGRLLAGGTLDVDDHEPDVRDDVVAAVRGEMVSLVPGAAGLAVDHAWTCFRPGTPDGMPVVDRVPGLDNAWTSVGHFRTGLLVAPAAGWAIASWIAGGGRPPELMEFGLARFA